MVVLSRDIHDFVDDNGRGFEFSQHPGLERPLHPKLIDVGRRNLGQRTVPLSAVVAGIGQPAIRVLQAPQKLLRGDLLGGRFQSPR